MLEGIADDGCIGLSVAEELHGVAMSTSFGDARGAGAIQFCLIAKNTEELKIRCDFVSPCKCEANLTVLCRVTYDAIIL
jgi:hypothetical protein